ncbi:hypothetical protein VEE01_44600 (plasmid) [Escherichia coli]|nr:hypothetical protein VEE01_44600 [Escherichia coli]
MLLPLFPLPSRPTELIQFRQPNIADAMRFNSITPEEQEQQTTAYLKALLAEPAKHDPLTWTAQDRITALWWIFTGSRETPVETFTYTCKHCGKEHYYDCDMNALAEDIQVLEVELKWSTKTGHRVRVFSSIDFPIRLVVTHHYIRAVLVRCNIQRYSPLLRELHR